MGISVKPKIREYREVQFHVLRKSAILRGNGLVYVGLNNPTGLPTNPRELRDSAEALMEAADWLEAQKGDNND